MILRKGQEIGPSEVRTMPSCLADSVIAKLSATWCKLSRALANINLYFPLWYYTSTPHPNTLQPESQKPL